MIVQFILKLGIPVSFNEGQILFGLLQIFLG